MTLEENLIWVPKMVHNHRPPTEDRKHVPKKAGAEVR